MSRPSNQTLRSPQSAHSHTWARDFVPAWAQRAVWYQIFPERFCNGDPSNDPRLADQGTAWPHAPHEPWQIHPWTADWYARQPYEEAHPQPFHWHALRRRYGGDLQGILDRLDYLQELGVTALYLNPLFEAASHHKYDGHSYHHVDPTFGPDPDGDRRLIDSEVFDQPATWLWTAADRLLVELIAEVHRRGMRIILDGVFNHMGRGALPFRDLEAHQQQSRFRDWFKVRQFRNNETGDEFRYEGWFGVPDLPELNQDANGLVAGPRDYVFAATRRWMDPDGDGNPADGVDGWRLDVAFCIAHPFWKAWRAHVRAINPEAYTVAEVIRPPSLCEPYLRGDEFDAVMNYNFAMYTAEFLWEGRSGAAQYDADLRALRAAYPPEVAYVLQNLGASHDTARPATLAAGRERIRYRDWPNSAGQMRTESGLADPRRPDADARALARLCILIQMTYVGAPMLYYGDEAGMWGPNDPDNRKPMLWPDLTYEDEVYLPNGARRATPDAVAFDHDLFAYCKQLIALRKESDALTVGTFRTLYARGDIWAFERAQGDERLIVAVNRGRRARTVTLEADGRYEELLHGGKAAAEQHSEEGARLRVRLPARGGVLLRRAAFG